LGEFAMEKEKQLEDFIGIGLNNLPGGKPNRTDRRRQKMEKIIKKETRY
jgi:hypothetical protein